MKAKYLASSVNWCGGLTWDLPPAELDAYADERAAWGHPIQRVSRDEILALEPNLKDVPDHAYHVAGEGMLEPLAATQALLAAAQRQGADVLGNTPIKWLEENDEGCTGVMTNDGVIHADEIVVGGGQPRRRPFSTDVGI